VSFLLTNSQVWAEASTLFEREYAHQVTFYFDEATALVKLSGQAMNNAILANARFSLRADSDVACDSIPVRDNVEELIVRQPGAYDLSHLCPENYRRNLYRNQPFYGAFDTSDGTPSLPPLGTLDHGFELVEGEHSVCNSHGERQRTLFRKLVWPRLANGCQIATYATIGIPRHAARGGSSWPEELSCLVLKGKMAT